jgi:hypothetical protein
MNRPGKIKIRLYSVGIEDDDHTLYEIVLPGRTHAHACQAANTLLTFMGPSALKPFDMMAPHTTDLKSEYVRTAPKLLEQLFDAYDHATFVRSDFPPRHHIFKTLEFQIDVARSVTRPAPEKLREYIKHRALNQLPAQINTHGSSKKPANPFQADSRLTKEPVKAAKSFSRFVENEAREAEAFRRHVNSEIIRARKSISATAQQQVKQVRALIAATFAPHYKALRSTPEKQAPNSAVGSIGHHARIAARKAVMKAQQQAFRAAIKPILREKQAALAKADEQRARFNKIDRQLTMTAQPVLQKQWREISTAHARQKHGPAQPALEPQKGPVSFMDRIASRANQLRTQIPAQEQDNSPEPDK